MPNKKTKIESQMTAYPSVVSPTTSVNSAIDLMEGRNIRHLPVVEHGRVVGIVSERDLRQAEMLSDAMTLVVADFMISDPYCVEIGTSIAVVAQVMAERKYGSVVVLSRSELVVGIFTTTDGMKLLAELLTPQNGMEVRDWGIERFLSSTLF